MGPDWNFPVTVTYKEIPSYRCLWGWGCKRTYAAYFGPELGCPWVGSREN